MKVICEYCDSLVEVETESVCPRCGGPLTDVMVKERARLQAEEEARKKQEQEALEKAREAEQNEQMLAIIGSVASSAVGGMIGRGLGRGLLRGVVRSINRPLSRGSHGPVNHHKR